MFKFLVILVFTLFTSVAPYATINGLFANVDQTEKSETNNTNLVEEKIEPNDSDLFVSAPEVAQLDFPARHLLKPQSTPDSFHKPPSFSFLA